MAYRIEDMEHPLNCLCCGDPIPYGRPDRKFCSTRCKNLWQNIAPINKGKFPGHFDKKNADL